MNQVSQSLQKKIRALLSKTVESGASEAEATTAADMVRRLLDKHNLSMRDLPRDNAGVQRFNHPERKTYWWSGRMQPWQMRVAQGVAKLYECQLIMSRNRPIWVGDETDVTICADVFDFVIDQIYLMKEEAFARAKQNDYRFNGAIFTNSYHKGISIRLYTILSQMAEQRKESLKKASDSDSRALMVISSEKEQAVTAWMKQQKFTTHHSSESVARHAAGYRAGQADATRVRVSKEVGGSCNV